MAYIGFFQAGRQHHIEQDTRDQVRKVGSRQGNKSKHRTEGSKGDHRQYGDAGHGEQGQRCGGPALEEGQLGGSDHMDDQGLTPHGFHKPARLKEADIFRLHQRQLRAAEMGGQVVKEHAPGDKHGTKDEIHKKVGGKVKDGAGGPDPEHEITHAGGIPLPGLSDKFLVHIVPGNGSAGQVVNQVEENEMYAHHGQEGQQRRGSQDREHIAEVGGGGHLDVFDHVGVSLAAFDDALLQYHQVLLQQDNIRRLFRYIHCRVHGNTDVGSFHGSRIVDAVPHKADGVPAFPQHRYNPGLLVRSELGEHISRRCRSCQLIVAHSLQVGTKQHIAYLQPHLLADGSCHLVVVTGENFRGHAMLFEGSDRVRCGLLGRIQEGQISNE